MKIGFVTALALVGSVCVLTNAGASTPASANAQSPCLVHFKVEGSTWHGRTFRSYQDFNGVKQNAVFIEIAQHLAIDGWKIASSSIDTGILSAEPAVAYAHGQTVPFNVVVQGRPDGTVHVETVFKIPGGQEADNDSIQKEFCEALGGVK